MTILEDVQLALKETRLGRGSDKKMIPFLSYVVSELTPKDKTQKYDDGKAAGRLRKLAEASDDNFTRTNEEQYKVEAALLRSFLPQPLSQSEAKRLIAQAALEVEPNMGNLMKWMKGHLGSRFDGKIVSPLVKQYLEN